MPAPFDNIVQHLFHQPSLQSVTVDELERMAQQHPYFAAAHFLLLKKMQDTAHPSFTNQLHKTTLYFNNPLWLQFLLQPETVSNFIVSREAPFINSDSTASTGAESMQPENVPEHVDESGSAPAAQLSVTGVSDSDATVAGAIPATADGMMEVITAVFEEQTINNTAQDVVEEKLADAATETKALQTATSAPEEPTLSTEPVNENIAGEHFPDNIAEAIRADAETTEITQPTSITAEGNVTLAEAASGGGAIVSDLQEAENPEEADATDAPQAITGHEINVPLLKTIIETPAAHSDTLFEPFHTVDYFASQGIKLSKMEADGKDKLGRQLKSFTDWLKTMKKLPQVSINKILAENEESKVVADAIHSLENKEVITEAMAEVFEKQGLYDKAAQVYQKLSLLNPGKSAYFAAKIDVLKH
ncbi:MAG: hypothetical protein ABIQ88_01920 [Chitinophagaceae bacterium]